MKILILANSYLFDTPNVNGTLVQLHNLSQGFVSLGHKVYYVTFSNNLKKPYQEEKDGVVFYRIYSKNSFLKKLLKLRRIKRIMKEINPDAIYVRGRNILQLTASNYSKSNNINFIWGTNGEDSAEFWKNIKRLKKSNKPTIKKVILFPIKFYEDLLINKGMKNSNIIVNQTNYQQIETKRLLKKNGHVVSNFFQVAVKKKSKKNQILWLATLSKNKQPNIFIKLKKSCNTTNWNYILGGGTKNLNYKQEIYKRSKEAGVKFLGYVKYLDSFKLYEKSKIYINTSRKDSDGLPNAFIQSWLNGVVVLSLNHNPNNWLHTHKIGYCAEGDFNKLVDMLVYLTSNADELEIMSRNCIKFSQNNFSNKSILKSYISLFQQ